MTAILEDIKVEPAAVALGARIAGVDLGTADAALVAHLRSLLLQHHVLVIAGQSLSPAELVRFGERWGVLLTHPAGAHRDEPYVQRIAHNGSGGRRLGAWHSDMTWHPTPPAITILHARTLPPFGGDTLYANQHLAYETLDEAGKAKWRQLPTVSRIDGLRANHTGKSFGPQVPDSIHPMVRTHDETHRRALYVNPEFTTNVVDMDERESKLMLNALCAHAVSPEFCYRHAWTVGDVLVWDNRSVLHFPVVDYNELRVMHRVVIRGDAPA